MTVKELVPLTAEQQALVKGAASLVEKVARYLAPRYESLIGFDDMLALGREGLVQAAKSFDPTLGVAFTTFATYRVQGAMLDGIRKEAGRAREIALSCRIAGSEYLAVQRETGDVMTDTDEDYENRLETFADGLAAAMFTGLVSAATRGQSKGEDAAVSRDSYARAIRALEKATSTLPEREKKLIDLHYRENRELKEVAQILGVSYASVRRYHAGVMERLAVRMRAQGVTEAPPMSSPG